MTNTEDLVMSIYDKGFCPLGAGEEDVTGTCGSSTGVQERLCLGMVPIPRQVGLGRTASALIKQNYNSRQRLFPG